MKDWYKKTFLWAQTNLTEDDAKKTDIGFWRNYWRENGIQGVIINCSGIVTYYQTEYENQKKARFLGDGDCYGLWNQAAREEGLAVVARMDMNVTEENQVKEHPDWYCRDEKGSLILSQGRYVTCINGGYYRERIPAIFKEVIEKYSPDGFADNNWSGLRRDTICYCENCREKFREFCGEELPKEHDWSNPVYRKWVKWGYETRVSMWDYLNEVTNRYGGEDCLWIGMLNADPIQTRSQFYDVRRLVKRSKIVFLDNQSREEEGGFEQNSIFGNLVRAMTGDDTVVAESMSQYYRGIRTFRLSSASPGEARLWSLTGISAGISPWYHFVGGGTLDKRKFKISRDILSWYQKSLPFLTARKNMANIAVLWNQETSVYYGQSDGKEKCAYPWLGFARALTRAGVPFIPLHILDIDRYRNQIETYVIPNAAVMSDEEVQLVMSEMKAGKNFVISGKCAEYGELGAERKESPVLRFLGLQEKKEYAGSIGTGSSDWTFDESHNYLKKASEEHGILQGFEDTEILPFGGAVEVIESSGPLTPVLEYIPALPIYPPEFSWIRQESEIGGIYAGEICGGARVVYLAADIDRCYGKYLLPDHRRLLCSTVQWAAGKREAVCVETKGDVCCNVYAQEGRWLIHLVNLTGDGVPLGTLEHTIAIQDVLVTVNCSDTVAGAVNCSDTVAGAVSGKVTRVRGLIENELYCFEKTGEKVRIKIPVLREQELLAVELE